MDRGTVNTRIIKRSILKHIARTEPVGTTVGTDYSVVDRGASPFAIITAQGFSEYNAEMAYIRALNNLAAGGTSADSIIVDIQAEAYYSEDQLRREMNRLSELSHSRNIRIIGGNTTYMKYGGHGASFTITAFGKVEESVLSQLTEKLTVGDRIVIIGDSGRYGASLIVERARREFGNEQENLTMDLNKNLSFLDRFAKSYLDGAVMDVNECYIQKTAKALVDGGVSYIHDVSFGGIYRTLTEIAEYSGRGIDIVHEQVPIRQDTIEICEFTGINPYELLGTGGVVAVVKPDKLEELEEHLREAGIKYSIAGELTEAGERVVHSSNFHMKRSLTYYEGDALYKVLN